MRVQSADKNVRVPVSRRTSGARAAGSVIVLTVLVAALGCRRGEVSGRLRPRLGGEPVSGHALWIECDGNRYRNTSTDGTGAFRFVSLPGSREYCRIGATVEIIEGDRFVRQLRLEWPRQHRPNPDRYYGEVELRGSGKDGHQAIGDVIATREQEVVATFGPLCSYSLGAGLVATSVPKEKASVLERLNTPLVSLFEDTCGPSKPWEATHLVEPGQGWTYSYEEDYFGFEYAGTTSTRALVCIRESSPSDATYRVVGGTDRVEVPVHAWDVVMVTSDGRLARTRMVLSPPKQMTSDDLGSRMRAKEWKHRDVREWVDEALKNLRAERRAARQARAAG